MWTRWKWPRGRFNGERIVGCDLRVRLDFLWWGWRLPDRYGSCLSIGPLHVWMHAAYHHETQVGKKP